MIRLATCFSGIGAIEHALYRMQLDHRIVFACDNGDIDILTKKVAPDIDEIGSELSELHKTVSGIRSHKEVEDLYKDQLTGMLEQADHEFTSIKSQLEQISSEKEAELNSILGSLLGAISPDKKKVREYKALSCSQTASYPQRRLSEYQAILKLTNELKKNTDLKTAASGLGGEASSDTAWNMVSPRLEALYDQMEAEGGKKLIRKVQDLSQRTSQLHEKINYLHIQRRLEDMGTDWKARKALVDSLYKGMDSRNKVKLSYRANYQVADDDFHWNVAFLDGRQYKGQVDLFVGGSPCQSFSLVGKQRGLEDTRGTLFYEFARLIKEIEPKVFIYENVKAVISNDNGRTWKKMQQVFEELGYDHSWRILNAKDFGIPQNRERLFVVGFRNDLKLSWPFTFPDPIPLKRRMQDFLIDNAPGGYFLPAKGVEFVTREQNLQKKYTQIDGEIQLCQKKNQQFNWHGDFIFQSEQDAADKQIPELEKYFLSEKVRKYVLGTGTKNFYSRPATDLDIARPLLTTMHKMHRAGVDNYVTTDGRLRKLTPRECLRLMGFSDDFKIVVSDTSMYQQAGNSIVVDVLIHIMEQILRAYPELGQ